MVCLRLWQLETALQEVEGFRRPQLALEQYVTPAHIAAHVLYTAERSHSDLAGRRVLDLGCGPGILSIGSALLGASHVMAVDCDAQALEVALDNMTTILDEPGVIDLIQADVGTLADKLFHPSRRPFDTVITNPPFGTKHNVGADMEFVRVALTLAGSAVYSLHKRAAREKIRRQLQRWGCQTAEVLAELRYDLPRSYKFHRKHSVDIEVDLWRIVPPDKLNLH